jgi:hypothetical protein
MPLDEGLLSEARETRDRLIEFEYEAERTRLSYQRAIRRLHAAGGSLREIGEALGLSHQRVHQIVEGVAGKVAVKPSRAVVACSFCGFDTTEARRVIAGPGVSICDRCVALATEVVRAGGPKANERVKLAALSDPTARCSFCGEEGRSVPHLMGTTTARICGECLGICTEILVGGRGR